MQPRLSHSGGSSYVIQSISLSQFPSCTITFAFMCRPGKTSSGGIDSCHHGTVCPFFLTQCSGRSCLQSSQQPAHGSISYKDSTSMCTVATWLEWMPGPIIWPGTRDTPPLEDAVLHPSSEQFYCPLSPPLPGKLNWITDALSHIHLLLSSALAPQADPQPTQVPTQRRALDH